MLLLKSLYQIDDVKTVMKRASSDGWRIGPAKQAGKGHIVEILDDFESEGPNGRHQCLVTEALGPVLNPSMVSPELSPEAACGSCFPIYHPPFHHSTGVRDPLALFEHVF